MEIEIFNENSSGYLKAKIQSVGPNGATVTYDDNDLHSAIVPFESMRLSPINNDGKAALKDGDMVEVYGKSCSDKEQYIGWYPATLRSRKGDIIFVHYETPGSAGRDIVTIEHVRPMNYYPCFDKGFDCFQETPISIPQDLRQYFQRPLATEEFATAVANCIVWHDVEKSQLLVTSCYYNTVRRAQLISDLYFRDLRRRIPLTLGTEHEAQQLSEEELQVSDSYAEQFFVSSDLIGLAVGSDDNNLNRVRGLAGIIDIVKEECDDGVYLIKILAETIESARRAREMLEIVDDAVILPRDKLEAIIGPNNEAMEVIHKFSAIAKLEPDQDNSSSSFEDTKLILTGTRGNVNDAKIIIQYRMRYVEELELLEGRRQANDSSTPSLPPPPVSPTNSVVQGIRKLEIALEAAKDACRSLERSYLAEQQQIRAQNEQIRAQNEQLQQRLNTLEAKFEQAAASGAVFSD